MKQAHGILLAGALLMVGFTGCSATLQGAKEDAAKDASTVGAVTKDAGQTLQNEAHKASEVAKTDAHNAKAAVKNSASAATTTPVVKAAIIADAVLNDKRNHINVDTVNGVVKLSGHVTSEGSKQRASEDAAKALSNEHSHLTVKNVLTIQP
jgi:osmotically-inducible protein OsmY